MKAYADSTKGLADEVPRLAVRARRDPEPVDALWGRPAVRARDLDCAPRSLHGNERLLDRGRRRKRRLLPGVRHREHGAAAEHQPEPEDRHEDRMDDLRDRSDDGAEHEYEEPHEDQGHPRHIRGVVPSTHGPDVRHLGRVIRLGHGGRGLDGIDESTGPVRMGDSLERRGYPPLRALFNAGGDPRTVPADPTWGAPQ